MYILTTVIDFMIKNQNRIRTMEQSKPETEIKTVKFDTTFDEIEHFLISSISRFGDYFIVSKTTHLKTNIHIFYKNEFV